MRRIRNKDTNPELQVRRLVFKMGYRYRLHCRNLPGKPDLVFSRRKKVVFVHGCFWHLHKNCGEARLPKTNTDYWWPKLKRNKARDAKNQAKLEGAGWSCLVLWECQLKHTDKMKKNISRFLDGTYPKLKRPGQSNRRPAAKRGHEIHDI